jgi:hypothetical protein
MKLTSKALKRIISEEIGKLSEEEEAASASAMRKWMLNLSKDSQQWAGIDSTEAGLLQQLFGSLINASREGTSVSLLTKLIRVMGAPEAQPEPETQQG